MEAHIHVVINTDLCSGCGFCIRVCPLQTLLLVDGKASVIGETCISCGHCTAACPKKAICVPAIDAKMGEYQTFSAEKRWLPHGQYDTAGLVRLMTSRRSCRNFNDRTVDRGILEDLVKIGITAPSGTNSQRWVFTIVPTRKAVTSFANHISSFFKKLNTMAEKTILRATLKIMGKKELDEYFREYYPKVRKALQEWDASGTDRLFHGASSAIIVSSKPGASCPMEDALLATQNILLAAYSMGLGSCLIGYAVAAMRKDPNIQRSLGMPADETVYAVIALGYPDEVYESMAGRKKVELRFFEE